MLQKDITILVNSCDSYEDTWEPFFFLLKKFWRNCPYDIVLNTESKLFQMDGLNIKTLQLYKKQKSVCYGKRLLEHLRYIETEYVLLLMDDFFIRQDVCVSKIMKCLNWLKENRDIAVFSFADVRDTMNINDNRFEGFELRPQIGEYKVNLQAALWRKISLMKYIKPHENPWELEVKGSQRTFKSLEKFYVYKISKNPIIDYGKTSKLDWGIVRGKWVIEDVQPLFDKNNIQLDYSVRGYLTRYNIIKDSSVPMRKSILSNIKSFGFRELIKRSIWRGKRKIMQLVGLNVPKDYIDYMRKRKK